MNFLDSNVLVDGVRLAYRDRGAGAPVVFVHGTPSLSYEWRHVVPHVERAEHRVVTYDLLGFGQSERPLERDTSVGAQTDLLVKLLDALELGRVDLVAHDIGGAIAQRMAVLYPQRVRRVMLLDTVSYDSWPSQSWQEIIKTGLEELAAEPDELRHVLTRQLAMTVSDQDNMTGEVLREFLAPHHGPLGTASFVEHQVRHYDATYTEEIAGRLGEITAPVRLLWGGDDQWQPTHYAERLAADIPNAELVIVPAAGHFVMEDDPERVTQEVIAFLA